MAIVTSQDLSRAELQRRTAAGRLQRLAAGIYSDDCTRTPEQVVAREWREIVAKALPAAVISYANAFSALPADGELNVSHPRRNPLILPGLTIRPDMVGRRDDDDIPLRDGLFLASVARALVDNSGDHPGRPNRRIVKLTREQLHDQIVQLTQTTSPRRIDALIADVKGRASTRVGLGIESIFRAARVEIRTVDTPSRALRAAQTGEGYDRQRVALLRQLVTELAGKAPIERLDVDRRLTATVPFFEAYFSNYIEGTEFTLEEAEQLVADDATDFRRPEDAHDIRGTFAIVTSPDMASAPADADSFLAALRARHALMMAGRPQTLPGQWKDRANRAGATQFVAPELVPGTLRAGWEEGAALDSPFHRAVYLMFLVSEVHPFVDGNGRSARIAMNAELVAARQHRIIVPTILRLDYLGALSRTTNAGGPDALFRVLDHAQHWVSAGDWSTTASGAAYVTATNALVDARQAEDERVHLEVPRWSAIAGRL